MGAISVTIPGDALNRVIRDLDQIPERIAPMLAGALNDTAKKGRTYLNKQIRELVFLKRRDVAPFLRLEHATQNELVAAIVVDENSRVPLRDFGAKERKPQGVFYDISTTSAQTNIPDAFTVEKFGGHVFKRTGEFSIATKGRYAGKRREGIFKPMGVSAWGVVVKNDLDKDVAEYCAKEIEKDIDHRLNFELLKASGQINR